MSWYTVARLIEKGIKPREKTYARCEWCGKWATHPTDPKAGPEEYVYKDPSEMDSEEIREFEELRSKVDIEHLTQAFEDVGVTSGICDECARKLLKPSLQYA